MEPGKTQNSIDSVNEEPRIAMSHLPDPTAFTDVPTSAADADATRDGNHTIISPDHPALHAMGRIDLTDPTRPVWVYPYTQVSFRFTGTSLGVTVVNHWNYGDTKLGVIVDGVQTAIRIPSGFTGANDMPNSSTSEGTDAEPVTAVETDNAAQEDVAVHTDAAPTYGPVTVTLADRLPDIEHEVTLFKRQDGQHYLEVLDYRLDEGATILQPATPEPTRRIEVFGDSVSCGERNEASLYVGRLDPAADLSGYSNAWYSYAAITARNLSAQLHDTSQGGISLLDGIGWFAGPDYVGQESAWDCIQYNPVLGESKPWDFSRYTPHVVVVAIGQNDAHPDDFMASDYDGERARHWRTRYVDFLKSLHAHYPKATIVCLTTVLQHDPAWDRAIGEAVRTFNTEPDAPASAPYGRFAEGDAPVADGTTNDEIRTLRDAGSHAVAHHFLFTRNGSATPGHPRVAEHEEMARELTTFIESLGEVVWQD